MIHVSRAAPAKVNLTLHITGRRDDGYHLLDSLVVFANLSDRVTARSAPDLRLSVTGPFSTGVPRDDSNSVLKAAAALARVRGVTEGAALTLEKHLPHAAGIGSGSADAAATLSALAEFWRVAPLPADAPEVLALGADVPACVQGPGPLRMTGIGEGLTPAGPLPDCALVLVNPGVSVPTAQVFSALRSRANPPMEPVPQDTDVTGLVSWLDRQRNDLLDPAMMVAPDIGEVIDRLRSLPGVLTAGMSGSGATCWGLVRNMADARHAARALQVAEMSWWVAPAEVLATAVDRQPEIGSR